MNLPNDPADLAGLIHDHQNGNGRRVCVPEPTADPLRHFGLEVHPFSDNVNPEFFYRTAAHEEALLAMLRCVEEHISLGLITATSGTGKTLLTQVLIQELDPRKYQPVLVLTHPGMYGSALLREIAAELKLELPAKRPSIHDMVHALQNHIINLYLQGLRLVLIIDEVHFLKPDSLHLLRTLSNVEVPERKLVSVLLFGEQSFLGRMEHPAYRSVFSRMFARYEIRPLSGEETAQYVKFRLQLAGNRPELIDSDAYVLLHDLSGGIPREINRVCHNALLWAARRGEPSVTAASLEELSRSGRI